MVLEIARATSLLVILLTMIHLYPILPLRLTNQPNIKAILHCEARLLDGVGNILSVTGLTSNRLLLPDDLLDVDLRSRSNIGITKQQPYSSATVLSL